MRACRCRRQFGVANREICLTHFQSSLRGRLSIYCVQLFLKRRFNQSTIVLFTASGNSCCTQCPRARCCAFRDRSIARACPRHPRRNAPSHSAVISGMQRELAHSDLRMLARIAIDVAIQLIPPRNRSSHRHARRCRVLRSNYRSRIGLKLFDAAKRIHIELALAISLGSFGGIPAARASVDRKSAAPWDP